MQFRNKFKLKLTYHYQSYLLFILWISGTIKQFLYAFHLNIDIVSLSAAFVIVDIFLNIFFRKIILSNFTIKVFLLILLLLSFILTSLIYSPSSEYKFEKAFSFLVNILYFLYPVFIKSIDINKITKSYLFIVLPLSVIYVYFTSIMWNNYSVVTAIFREAGFDYLSIGFHLGILVLLLNYQKYPLWLQLITLLLLFASAARGPLIITLIVLFVTHYKKFIEIKKRAFTNMLVICLLTVSIFSFFQTSEINIFDNAISRFRSLESGNDNSTNARLEMMRFAFQYPFKSESTILFGNGFGSFGILFNNLDARAYPHNIFLEIFFELGLIGTLILSLLFITLFSKSKFRSNIFAILLLFATLNAFKSSSVIDLWTLFSFVGCYTKQIESNKTYSFLIQ